MTNTKMTDYTFDISQHKYEQLTTDVRRYNKIAARMDSPPISIELESTYKSFDPLAKVDDNDLTWTMPQITYYRGSIKNYDLKFGNYSFAGTLNHHKKMLMPDGTYAPSSFARAFPNKHIPSRFNNIKPACDHCETKRYRTSTYIVHNLDDDTYQQVGSKCFNVFFGTDASDIIRLLRVITRISDMDNYVERTRKRSPDRNPQFNTQEILKIANALIRIYGYHSTKSNGSDIPTAEIIKKICMEPSSREAVFWLKRIKEERNESIDDVVAATVSKWILAETGANDYMRRLRRIVNTEVVHLNDIGTLCSAIESHKNNVMHKLEKKREHISEHFGNVGEKYELSLKCLEIRDIDSAYGATKLLKLVDDKGHLFAWFNETGSGFKVGKIQKMHFKVKKHEVYKTEKRTMIFWVKKLEEFDERYQKCPDFDTAN